MDAPVGMLALDFEIIHLGHDSTGPGIAAEVEVGCRVRRKEIQQNRAELTGGPGAPSLFNLRLNSLAVDLDIAIILPAVFVDDIRRNHVDRLEVRNMGL